MSSRRTIAITGASGFLGAALVEHFASKGWDVIALVRNPSRYQPPATNVTARRYDMLASVPNATLQGTDYLVHAAYLKLSKDLPDAYDRNLTAAKRLLTAAKRSKLKHIVFISSMSAHDEAISVYGRQKLASEQIFLTQTNTTVLRPGLILGQGGIVKEMSNFMRSKHLVPLIDGGNQPLQVIALYDLVAVIDRVVSRKVYGLLTVATPEVYTYKQFYQELAQALHTTVLYVPVPYELLMLLFRIIAVLHIPVGVGADNLKGLKMLRSAPTKRDLATLRVDIDTLPVALKRLLQ